MVEIEGKIYDQTISILVGFGSSLNYASPTIPKSFKLDKAKHNKPLLVELANGTKWKVSELKKEGPLEMNGLKTIININIFPLSSYDIFIGMDSLETHRVVQ